MMKRIFLLMWLGLSFGLGAPSLALAQPKESASTDKSLPSKASVEYAKIISKVPVIETLANTTRLQGYRVTYEYAGKQYVTQVVEDPGMLMPIQIVAAGNQVTPEPAPVPSNVVITPSPPVIVPPPQVIYTVPPMYTNPFPYRYSPYFYGGIPFGMGLDFHFGGYGHRGWRH